MRFKQRLNTVADPGGGGKKGNCPPPKPKSSGQDYLFAPPKDFSVKNLLMLLGTTFYLRLNALHLLKPLYVFYAANTLDPEVNMLCLKTFFVHRGPLIWKPSLLNLAMYNTMFMLQRTIRNCNA